MKRDSLHEAGATQPAEEAVTEEPIVVGGGLHEPDEVFTRQGDGVARTVAFLSAKVAESIALYTKKQKKNGRLGVVTKFLALGMSAVVTILLGLNLEPALFYNRIALTVSALIGMVGGLSVFFDFNELALKYKDTVDRLELLKVKLEYLSLEEKENHNAWAVKLKDEYIQILRETHEFFQKVRMDDKEKTSEGASK